MHKIKELLKELYFLLFKKQYKFQPVFLIGCGRSGTTILGNTIGKHDSIAYLNEKRSLWHNAYPDFDIWSGEVKKPKLIATDRDNDFLKTKVLRKLFHKQQVLQKSVILLEKLPINNFRLDFIESAFPEAKYIYLHRNGVEVANSIKKMIENRNWFGKNETKWKLIQEELKIDNSKEFSNYEKGLLEWNLSLQYSEKFFNTVNKERYYSISYESFLENPEFQLSKIFEFLNLKYTDTHIGELTKNIHRRSEKVITLTDDDKLLGGENLVLSIENKLRQTCPNKE